MKLSLAIPTYNSFRFLGDCLKVPLESELFQEIVICDDASTDKLEFDPATWDNPRTKKIKLFRNKTNVGAFNNKYRAVEKCKSDWVYLLDSDNYLREDSVESLSAITDNLNSDFYYSPSELHLTCEENNIYDFYKQLCGTIVGYHYNFTEVDLKIAQESLNAQLPYFDWLINTGNFLVHRETFLKTMKNIFQATDYPFNKAGDAMVMCCQWLKSGRKIKIVNDLFYNHRIRRDSVSAAGDFVKDDVGKGLEYHKQKLLEMAISS